MTAFSSWFKSTLTRISPRLNTEVVYFAKFHKRINLKNPRTLDEKIQWLKFHDYRDNKLVRDCADKYAVRKYIESCGCPEILNDLYGVYDCAEGIPWDTLPEKFVAKWNFGCGENLIVHSKKALDIEDAKHKLDEWYKDKDTFYLPYAELQYRGIEPKIVVERFIEPDEGLLPVDYKFYCFNGNVACVLMCCGRQDDGHGTKYYFFDSNWNLLRYNKTGKAAPQGFTLPKPEGIEKAFEYASILSKPFPFVRADFYIEKGKVIFGELTFTPCGGYDTNRLPETQLLFGDMVKTEDCK